MKKRKSNKALGVAVLVVVVIVVIIAAMYLSSPSGQYWYTSTMTQGCIDNDGLNYNMKGVVTAYGGTLTDFCSTANKVVEYYCSNDVPQIKVVECAHGCSDGACIG